jgi:stearoyl-CoA desaturase (delta-9 desaturase)
MPSSLLVRPNSADSSLSDPTPPAETQAKSTGAGPSLLLWFFLLGPVIALAVGVVLAAFAGIGPGWLDLGLALVFYAITGFGVTVGFHRYFTHRSFKARRPLRIALAVAGSMAVEGSVTSWVADHRRHHAHSDHAGDPHSPWRFGTSRRALIKGIWWAHVGWLFADVESSRARFAPDLEADPDIRRINRIFPVWVLLSLLGPALLGGLITLSWTGAFTAFVWAGLVRMLLLHHVTWAVNSICHVIGKRPFASRDKSGNVAALAILSFGDSWHNLHHAEPTSARHGVDHGQFDLSAELIRGFERLGWAYDVRWPNAQRLDQRRTAKACLQEASRD